MSGSSSSDILSRDVLKWLQALNLTYPVKNTRRAFSNGFLVAEIVSNYSDLEMHAFQNASSLKGKLANWEMLSKFFNRHNIPVAQSTIEGLIHCKKGVAVPFIEFLYTFLTGKKVKKRRRRGAPALAGAEGAPTPDFAKPTASKLIKEALAYTEDELVQDREVRAAINEETIRHHLEEKREHLRTTQRTGGRSSKRGPGETISRRGSGRGGSGSGRSGVIEIKEVSRRSRRDGAGPSDVGGGRGGSGRGDDGFMGGTTLEGEEGNPMEMLAGEDGLTSSFGDAGSGPGESSVMAMMNDVVLAHVQDTEVYSLFEPRDAPISGFLEHLRSVPANLAGAVFTDILARCAEFTEVFLRESSVPVDGVLGSAPPGRRTSGQFAAFSRVMLSALQYSPGLSAFEHAVHVMASVGQHLVSVSPAAAWALFEDTVLPKLVARLASTQTARGALLRVVLSFSDNTPAAHLGVINRVVEYQGVLSKKNALVPSLLVLFRMEPAYDAPLLTTYVMHADAGLAHPNATVRVASLALLTAVVTSSALAQSISNGLLPPNAVLDFVLPHIDHIQALATDAHWQVQGQLLCLAGFLLERLPSRHPSERALYALVEDVLAPTSPLSVKKIGLSTLAPTLAIHPTLGLHYLTVLLSLPHALRASLLGDDAVAFMIESQVSCVPHYTLPPPSHTWAPLVVASSLVLLIQERGLDNLEREHMAVLRAALRTESRTLDSSTVSEWSRMWGVLHEFVFVGLCDDDVVEDTVGVLQELFSLVPGLVMDSLTTQLPTLIGCLRMLIRMGSLSAQTQTANWLASLFNQGGGWQQAVGNLMLSASASEVGHQGAPLQRLQSMVQQFVQ